MSCILTIEEAVFQIGLGWSRAMSAILRGIGQLFPQSEGFYVEASTGSTGYLPVSNRRCQLRP